MGSDVHLNRRYFFRKSVASILDCVCKGCASKYEYFYLDDGKDKLEALWSDFTPEMIRFEAKRLGIDPEDKDEIFKRIQQEMLDAKD